MKKARIMLLVAFLMPLTVNAQLGGLLEKAAKKTLNKASEKVMDKATERISDAASQALEKEVDKRMPQDKKGTAPNQINAVSTYESLMLQLPELPTVDQLVKYKEAELNEKNLKLLTSRVTVFSAKVLDLSAQCAALQYANADSAEVMDAAYRMAEASTGLTKEEIDLLSKMTDEEQEAWLKAHYSQQRAQNATYNQVVDASKWLKPLQPMIDDWTAAGEKADAVYKDMNVKLRQIYSKYSVKMKNADGQELKNIKLAYYTEIVPHIRHAVQEAMNIRIKEQLPIAEKIEDKMVNIRKQNPDMISQLLCYPQLTATQYFTETTRLLEIPEFEE